MADLKIASGSWTELDEVLLDTFSTTAAMIISDPELYPLMVAEATLLTSTSFEYHKALSRYIQFGGSDNKDVKDVNKSMLFKAHGEVAVKLEATAAGSSEYLTRPGYHLDQKGGVPKTGRVPAPRLKKAVSQGTRGRVQFILEAQNSREINGVIGRRSLDNGVTWENGIIAFKLNFLLEDQPSGQAVLYQFQFEATYNRKSDWSEIIRVEIF